MELSTGTPPPVRVQQQLLRSRDVCAVIGVSRGHLYRLMRRPDHPFPQPIHVGRSARWPSLEVAAWIEDEIDRNRVAAKER